MSNMSSIYVFALSLVCVIASAVIGIAASESPPGQQQQQQIPQQRQEDDVGSMGLGAVLWSVLDDCYGDVDSVTVCLKSKALTAHDRAPGKPALTSVDGVTLAFRAGKSLDVDPQADLADRAALDAAPDADSKNVLLNDMLANRIDRLMSTRTVELDGAGQEGRKKKDKAIQQAIMIAAMMAASVIGPMAIKIIILMAGKALLLSKIALLLSGMMMLKKLSQPQQINRHDTEFPASGHYYDPSIDAQHVAYSSQIQ